MHNFSSKVHKHKGKKACLNLYTVPECEEMILKIQEQQDWKDQSWSSRVIQQPPPYVEHISSPLVDV